MRIFTFMRPLYIDMGLIQELRDWGIWELKEFYLFQFFHPLSLTPPIPKSLTLARKNLDRVQ